MRVAPRVVTGGGGGGQGAGKGAGAILHCGVARAEEDLQPYASTPIRTRVHARLPPVLRPGAPSSRRSARGA